jgi:hypothetical protein
MSNKTVIKQAINRILSPPVPAPVVKPAPPAPKYVDKTIVCAGCGASFTWEATDQAYYARIGTLSAPRWCPPCRRKRREFFQAHPEFDRK